MIKKGRKIYGYKTEEFIKDVGTPERYKEIEESLKTGKVAF